MNLWHAHNLPEDTGTPPMAMDHRHVLKLHEALADARPRVAAEIGSYMGHSTVAFLFAMQADPTMELHVFEPSPTPELLQLLTGRHRVHLHREPIWGSNINPDFVFIDGDHDVPALADLAFCLAKRVRTIAMHDTRGHSAGLTPPGSEMAARLLQAMPGHVWWEDYEQRAGEWTQRGFGISTAIKP